MANRREGRVHRYYVCRGRAQAKVLEREPCPNQRWRGEELED